MLHRYLSLDDNQKTEYKARELKSVHIRTTGMFLKIMFHKPHQNVLNTFNQVWLIAAGIFNHACIGWNYSYQYPRRTITITKPSYLLLLSTSIQQQSPTTFTTTNKDVYFPNGMVSSLCRGTYFIAVFNIGQYWQ